MRGIIAYAITHAPPGVRGGPYEGEYGAYARSVPTLGRALRSKPSKRGLALIRGVLAIVRDVRPHARVIRIVRKARPSSGQESSAVEVLRELVAWDEDCEGGEHDIVVIADKARAVLAASGPDPMPVVRAAMAWRENRGSTAPMNKLADAVDAYRKAGGSDHRTQ